MLSDLYEKQIGKQFAAVCCYNVVQYIPILHDSLQWQLQKINKILNSQITSHTLPSWASYGVFIVRIWEKFDSVIAVLHCI